MTRRWTRAAAAIGIVCVAIVLWQTLAHDELARTGTTDRPVSSHLTLAPGDLLCQGAYVPAGTAAASFAVSGGEVRLTIGSRIVQTSIRPGARFAFVPIRPVVRHTLKGANVCITNVGRSQVLVYGTAPDALFHSGPFVTRIDWFPASPQRRWSLGPTIARRLPLVKSSLLGTWTLWLALAAIVAISAVAVGWSLAVRDA